MPGEAAGTYALPQNQLLIATSDLLHNGCNDIPLVPCNDALEQGVRKSSKATGNKSNMDTKTEQKNTKTTDCKLCGLFTAFRMHN